MKTIYLFILFTVVALAQIYVPSQMILNRESILKEGEVYKFRTQPIDPSDPFRGKYIALNYKITSYKTKDTLWERNEPIYVYLKKDSLGYAKIDKVIRNVDINSENDYVTAKVLWYSIYDQQLTIEFPFNRYYMEESKAYDAEVAVRKTPNNTIKYSTYAVVHVKEGDAVLSDVLVNGIPIKDFVDK